MLCPALLQPLVIDQLSWPQTLPEHLLVTTAFAKLPAWVACYKSCNMICGQLCKACACVPMPSCSFQWHAVTRAKCLVRSSAKEIFSGIFCCFFRGHKTDQERATYATAVAKGMKA